MRRFENIEEDNLEIMKFLKNKVEKETVKDSFESEKKFVYHSEIISKYIEETKGRDMPVPVITFIVIFFIEKEKEKLTFDEIYTYLYNKIINNVYKIEKILFNGNKTIKLIQLKFQLKKTLDKSPFILKEIKETNTILYSLDIKKLELALQKDTLRLQKQSIFNNINNPNLLIQNKEKYEIEPTYVPPCIPIKGNKIIEVIKNITNIQKNKDNENINEKIKINFSFEIDKHRLFCMDNNMNFLIDEIIKKLRKCNGSTPVFMYYNKKYENGRFNY